MRHETPLSGLRDVDRRREENDRHHDFLVLAALIMGTDNYGEALARAEATGQSARVQTVLKAAQSAGMVANTGVAINELLRAFVDASKNYGCFDRIASSAMKVNFITRRVSVFSSVAASTVAEGVAKPIRRLQLSASDFVPTKVTATVVMTAELILALTSEGIAALGRELRSSVAIGSDSAFLSALSGESSEAMGLDTWAGFCDDAEELMRLVSLGVGSRPYFVATPQLAKEISAQAMANGILMAWNDASFAGIPILISDAQVANRLSLIDAAGLAVADGGIDLRSSGVADVQMDTSPTQESTTPTAVQQTSMFQTNSRCVICERSFAVKAIRPNAYAHATSVALADESGSPALA